MQPENNIVELTARTSYGRLLAYLSCRSNDIAACEDALADAFKAAIETWPTKGIPEKPEAWLLTVAKNKLTDGYRKTVTSSEWAESFKLMDLNRLEAESTIFRDERLKLLFVCAHPAIDPTSRTALMLQTVLGLTASEIASCFLLSPAAMAKKLGRVKRKIKETRISFSIPENHELSTRVSFVLEAIFGAYGKAWENLTLDDETIYLAELVVNLLPDDPEAKGLLALLLHCESRKSARRSPLNEFIPLDRQETSRWNMSQIRTAEKLLEEAFKQNTIGRFQLEAAIQSAHSARLLYKIDNREDICVLYERLTSITQTVGALVGQAAAMAELYGPEKALHLLAALSHDDVTTYQPYWVLKGELHRKLKQDDEAQKAYDLAIGLTEDLAVRTYLLKQQRA